jgi:hypothetical protein
VEELPRFPSGDKPPQSVTMFSSKTERARKIVSNLKDQLIWGADAIADELGRDRRQVYHLLTKGALPGARKVGGRWVIAKGSLWKIFRDEVAA